MVSRRAFLSLVAGSMSASRVAFAQEARTVALYAKVGADLTHYDVDAAGAALTKRGTVTLPAGVQYAWPHVSRRYLYVATSSSASGYGPAGTEHHVTAFRIDPASGALTKHGAAIRLPTRPIHMSTDIPSENILVAFNNPSAVRVYRINKDFSPGDEVKQPGPIDAGIFAHQLRVTPDNRLAVLVTRGNEATPTKAEDPGALKVFDYKDGALTNEVSIAPDGGKDFGAAASRFPSDEALDVRLDRDAEQDVHVQDGRRPDHSGDRLPGGNVSRAEEPSIASGSRHGPRASERPVSLWGESCPGHGGLPGQEGVQGWREQYRGVLDRPIHRRANSDTARRDARRPSAHVS